MSGYSASTGTIPAAIELNLAIGSSHFMRKFLLATSAAALALTLSGRPTPNCDKLPLPPPPSRRRKTTTTDGWCSPRMPSRPSRSTSRRQAAPTAARIAKPRSASRPSRPHPIAAPAFADRRCRGRRHSCRNWSRTSSGNTCRKSGTAPAFWRSIGTAISRRSGSRTAKPPARSRPLVPAGRRGRRP